MKSGVASSDIQGVVESVALTADGVVHASGHLRLGTQEALVARWSPLESGWRASATSSVLGDAPHTLVLDAGGTLTAGTGVGWYGSPLVRESQLSGYGWERVGGGVTRVRRAAWITALAATPDGRVVVGGVFDAAGSITAWGAAPPSKPAAPALTAKRTSITVRWAAPPTGSAPFGWIAEATAKGQTTRSCRADASERDCTITSLTPGATYSVRLVAYTIPAGPSPRSDAVKIATKK